MSKLDFNKVRDFLKSHYLHDRFSNSDGWNEDREERITKSVIENLEKYGEDVITHHSAKTFETIFFDRDLNIISKNKGQRFNLTNIF